MTGGQGAGRAAPLRGKAGLGAGSKPAAGTLTMACQPLAVGLSWPGGVTWGVTT